MKKAGYSPRSTLEKLGIRPGWRISWVRPPRHFLSGLGPMPESVRTLGPRAGSLDYVHIFVKDAVELAAELPKAKRRIAVDGCLWVSWPKLSSPLSTGLTENGIREMALSQGLVDVKVAAIDEDWSGLKLVYRLKDRGKRKT